MLMIDKKRRTNYPYFELKTTIICVVVIADKRLYFLFLKRMTMLFENRTISMIVSFILIKKKKNNF
jgi:hypothetical protein